MDVIKHIKAQYRFNKTFSFDAESEQQLNELCELHQLSASQIIRDLIHYEYLRSNDVTKRKASSPKIALDIRNQHGEANDDKRNDTVGQGE